MLVTPHDLDAPASVRHVSQRQWSVAAILLLPFLLFLFHVIQLDHDLRSTNNDLSEFFLPWLRHIIAFGRLRSLEASFANYSPPYIYLLSLGSLLHNIISDTTIVKLVNLPFILASGLLAFDICLALNLPLWRARAVGVLLPLSPEVWSNGFNWGQCDIVYTCFLLATFRLLLARRSAVAMVVFGSALAFKLQAIFFGPVLLALLLTGEIAVWQLALIPAAYLLWMVPAALAGRPWHQLFFVYAGQYDYYSQLSMHAPNPLFFIQPFVSSAYVVLVSRAAIVITGLASLSAVVIYLRRKPAQSRSGLLALATFCLLLEPYLLPKMHDRYFYPGDLFALVFVAVRPPSVVTAMLLQATAFLTYRQFLSDTVFGRKIMILPLILVTTAVLLAGWQFWREGRSQSDDGVPQPA